MSITEYRVEYGSMTAHDMVTRVDWERSDSWGQSFDRYQHALGFFTECEGNLRGDFLTEWNRSPYPRSATMKKKGFYTRLVRYEFDGLDDYDSDNWSDCEVRYCGECTYEDWQEENER